MMADNQVRLPSGMGGLVRYNEDASKVEIKPEYLVSVIAVVIIIEILLHVF
jgi:preprotein translocase subunit Sec61beta